jgi:multiple antibiotic resistance protein
VLAHGWVDSLVMTFVPLFVVIDAVGNIPFVVALSEGLSRDDRRKLVNLASLAAAAIGLGFLFLGRFLLNVLAISVGAFAVAGGLVLLVLAFHHMTTGRLVDTSKEDVVAVVPIGTPLTVGPGTIATLLLLASQFPLQYVLISFLLNMFIVFITFVLADRIARIMGPTGIKVFSRIAAIFLGAIAVSMIIRGLQIIGVIPAAA